VRPCAIGRLRRRIRERGVLRVARLAGKRHLLIANAQADRRRDFAAEVAADVERADAIAELARKGTP